MRDAAASIPSAEAGHKGTRFALKGYVRNIPDLAHRHLDRLIDGLINER